MTTLCYDQNREDEFDKLIQRRSGGDHNPVTLDRVAAGAPNAEDPSLTTFLNLESEIISTSYRVGNVPKILMRF